MADANNQEEGKRRAPPPPPPRSLRNYVELNQENADAIHSTQPVASLAFAQIQPAAPPNAASVQSISRAESLNHGGINGGASGYSTPNVGGSASGGNSYLLPGQPPPAVYASVVDPPLKEQNGNWLRKEPSAQPHAPPTEKSQSSEEDLEQVDIKATLELMERWPKVKNGYKQLMTFLIFFGLYCAVVMMQIDPATVSLLPAIRAESGPK
jgi:hypothetical protein